MPKLALVIDIAALAEHFRQKDPDILKSEPNLTLLHLLYHIGKVNNASHVPITIAFIAHHSKIIHRQPIINIKGIDEADHYIGIPEIIKWFCENFLPENLTGNLRKKCLTCRSDTDLNRKLGIIMDTPNTQTILISNTPALLNHQADNSKIIRISIQRIFTQSPPHPPISAVRQLNQAITKLTQKHIYPLIIFIDAASIIDLKSYQTSRSLLISINMFYTLNRLQNIHKNLTIYVYSSSTHQKDFPQLAYAAHTLLTQYFTNIQTIITYNNIENYQSWAASQDYFGMRSHENSHYLIIAPDKSVRTILSDFNTKSQRSRHFVSLLRLIPHWRIQEASYDSCTQLIKSLPPQLDDSALDTQTSATDSSSSNNSINDENKANDSAIDPHLRHISFDTASNKQHLIYGKKLANHFYLPGQPTVMFFKKRTAANSIQSSEAESVSTSPPPTHRHVTQECPF